MLITIFTIVILALSIIVAPLGLQWSLSVMIGGGVLVGYHLWWHSKSSRKSKVDTPEPKKILVEEKKTHPYDNIQADFNVTLKSILIKLNDAIIALPSDWKYQYINLTPESRDITASRGWNNGSYAILQKFDDGVILFRFYLDYAHYLFDRDRPSMLYSYNQCDYWYIDPSIFLNQVEDTVIKEVEKIIMGGIGERQKITFPKSLAAGSMGVSTLSRCIFGLNFAYSPIPDNAISTDRKTYYDEQAAIHQRYKDNLRLIVRDKMFDRFDAIVSDIKTKEASSQVMTSNKWQQITLSYSGSLGVLIQWGFICTLSKNEIIISGVCLEGNDIKAIFPDDEARGLMLNIVEELVRKALQSVYGNLECGPLQDDAKSQKASISITYTE